ncbi:hypothetical protein QE152_g15809 [Popillia japonica]|uniref:Endonuclease/exonuclease/phosphatase domain-containing protein n=1 Tax=Popillia japonica TaxID=7064 RepID=A0AAW1L6W5_POPJA
MESNTHGSDHFPIILQRDHCSHMESVPGAKLDLKNGNWTQFKERIHDQVLNIAVNADLGKNIQTIIQEAGREYLYRAPKKVKRPSPPRWDAECTQSIDRRRQSIRNFKKSERFLKVKKKASFIAFCSSLNRESNISDVWRKIKRFRGASVPYPETPLDMAWFHPLLRNLAPDSVRLNLRLEETIPLENFLCRNFTMNELECVTDNSKHSAPGPDNIHYQMIRNLPWNAKGVILLCYNSRMNGESIPLPWKESSIIPVLKPNKPPNLCASYWPICLCFIPAYMPLIFLFTKNFRIPY